MQSNTNTPGLKCEGANLPSTADAVGGLRAPPTARSAEGLVSYQQSSVSVPDAPEGQALTRPRGRVVLSSEQLARASERRAERRARVALLAQRPQPRAKSQQAARYLVTVESEDETAVIDTKQARIGRCQKRVHSWASVLPGAKRAEQRAYRSLKIGPRLVMLTLTYRDAKAWQANDIRDFMKGLRRELDTNLLAYAWVLEMQQRGAPHYHVLLYVKRGTRILKPDDKLWEHGSSRIETARSVFYIVTYTGKEYQKSNLPAGARMFAVQIYADTVDMAEMLVFRMSTAPAWLRGKLEAVQQDIGNDLHWSRCAGGGWVIRETGERLYSPWRVVSIVRM